GAQATGNGSTATGQSAQATGNGSTATGQSAQAKGKNSVALGANSVADKDNQVSIGQKITDATTGAVSYITRTLSNLTDGTDAHDAVNKGQLDTAKASAISEANKHTDDEIGKLDTKAQGYATTAQTAANKYTDDTAKKTLKTASENTERRALIAENNAVTRSNTYTDESSSRTLESANTYTNHRAVQAENNAVARSNTYTDNRFGELRKSLQHTEKRLNAGIAGVTAIASIPYVAENSFSYGIGLGNYQNGKALAAGVQYKTSPNTNIRLNVSWDSAGNTATGVGLSGGW
ncbi:YadA-like family protein, partial [Salmonella enterica]|uniref:YadA-like family protein n=1 Tax=Salmonella enterica TaxID=28901 RepID=UPI0009AF034B